MNSTEKQIRSRLATEWDRNTYAKNLAAAQRQLNKLIRMEAAGDWGDCVCVSCVRMAHWKTIDAGHFISATKSATRFDERNIHPQCKACNQFDNTNSSLIGYTMHMADTYGRDVIESLQEKSKQKKTWTKEEIIDLRVGWSRRIAKQKERLGE